MSEKELKIETEKQPSLVSICIITKNEKENLLSEDGKDYTICDEPRVFSKNYYHYEGAIHEQVVPLSNEMSKREYYHSGMCFIHTGYIGTYEEKARKIKRNIDLLEAELEKNPEDVYIWFQIGKGYYMAKDYENACKYFGQALEFDVDESLDYVQDLVESYGYSLVNTKQYEMAYSLLQVTYDAFAHTADYHFLAGLIYMQNAMFEDAVKEFLLATKNKKVCVVGANSYKAYYNIGVIYECLGDKKNARAYYKKCGSYDLALKRLKEV